MHKGGGILSKRDINGDIKDLGGNSSSEENSSSWRYFDVTSVPNDKKAGLAEFQPFLAKTEFGITSYALPLAAGIADVITAMGMDGEARIIMGDINGKLSSLLEGDYVKQLFEVLGITEITKEEFYSLE